eukprot:EG_transcript_24396
MTLAHFLNCSLLTFGAPWVLYKACLWGDDVGWNLAYGGLTYAAALLARMLLLATFSIFTAPEGSVDWLQEAFRLLFSVVDVAALYLLLKSSVLLGDRRTRVVSVGLGWSIGESLLTRLVPLWIGARGFDFSWEYLQMSLEANAAMALHVAFAAAVSLWRKPTRGRIETDPTLTALLAAHCALPSLMSLGSQAVGLGSWLLLAAQALLTVPYCALARQRFLQHEK